MPKNVDDIIRHLSPPRRKKVEKRAAQLVAGEMTRQELRRARERTQVDVAKALGITQDSVSRLEQRSDLLLSTLRNYVEALGGSLSLIAEVSRSRPGCAVRYRQRRHGTRQAEEPQTRQGFCLNQSRLRDSRTAAQQIASALRKFGQLLRSLAELRNREHFVEQIGCHPFALLRRPLVDNFLQFRGAHFTLECHSARLEPNRIQQFGVHSQPRRDLLPHGPVI